MSKTAKEHGVHRRVVQRWNQQKESLSDAAKSRDTSTRKRRRLSRSSSTACKFPDVETALVEWIKKCRDDRITVDGSFVQRKAIELFEEIKGNSAEGQFKASKGWLDRFLKRNELCSRVVTSQGQKVPPNSRELAVSFVEECGKACAEKSYPLYGIANFDETPLWFDMPANRTIDFRGVKTVASKTTGKEKLRYTVVLAAFADGSKLPPMIIFKGLKRIPKVQFPAGVVVQVSKGGSMTTELLLFWLKNVWRRRKNSIFCSPALLILDRHASHLHRDVLSAMSQQHQTKPVFVPPGMTPILQPCDVSWNKPFKDAMRGNRRPGSLKAKKNTQEPETGGLHPTSKSPSGLKSVGRTWTATS